METTATQQQMEQPVMSLSSQHHMDMVVLETMIDTLKKMDPTQYNMEVLQHLLTKMNTLNRLIEKRKTEFHNQLVRICKHDWEIDRDFNHTMKVCRFCHSQRR